MIVNVDLLQAKDRETTLVEADVTVTQEAAPIMAVMIRLTGEANRPVYDRLREAIETFVSFGIAHPEVRQFVAQHAAEAPERAAMLIQGNCAVRRSIFAEVGPFPAELPTAENSQLKIRGKEVFHGAKLGKNRWVRVGGNFPGGTFL